MKDTPHVDFANSEDQSGWEEYHAIDRIVERFEIAWAAGHRPQIDTFLPEGPDLRSTVLAELVHVELEWRIKAGEKAQAEHYFARYPDAFRSRDTKLGLVRAEIQLRCRQSPDHAGAIHEEFKNRFPELSNELAEIAQSGPRDPLARGLSCPDCHCTLPISSNEATASATVVCWNCGRPIQLLDGQPSMTTSDETAVSSIDRFQLCEEIGRGATAIVYRALDPRLERMVAIKVVRGGIGFSDEERDRFYREARSAAQLDFPGIIPVYEVGQASSGPYLVSQYVNGETLEQAIRRRTFSFSHTARIVLQVARALHHAHQRGVVHRDIKPSNIMLQLCDGGSIVPRVMDFGLALRNRGEVTMTVEGQLLGTPAYMSPEQARGDGHRVDGRSDIYSLGVVMYRMLTGDLPFHGNLRMLLAQVLYEDPRGARKLNDQIPPDLETICMKCLEKDPDKRYESAAALAADLRRFQQGKPILARPVGAVERLGRLARRNPRMAVLTSFSVLLLIALVGLSVGSAAWLSSAYRREQFMREGLERNLYYNIIHRADLHHRLNDLDGSRAALMQAESPSGSVDRRGWEWFYLRAISRGADRVWRGGTERAEWVGSLAFTPDGRLLATGSRAPAYRDRNDTALAALRVWDIHSGRLVFDLDQQTWSIVDLAFNHEGTRLAVAEQDLRTDKYGKPFAPRGRLRMWDTETLEEVELDHARGIYDRVEFDPSGNLLVADSDDGVFVWGRERQPMWHFVDVDFWGFAGGRLLCIDEQRRVVDCDLETGEIRPTDNTAPPGRLSAGGELSFESSEDYKLLRLWDAASGEVACELAHDGSWGVAVSRDAKFVAYCSDADRIIHVYDLESRQEWLAVRGNSNRICKLEFSPDGRHLAAGDWEGTVRLWNLEQAAEYRDVGAANRDVLTEAICFNDAGDELMVVRPRAQRLQQWNMDTGVMSRETKLPLAWVFRTPARTAAISRDGSWLAAEFHDKDSTLGIWETATGRLVAELSGHTKPIVFISFDRTRKHLLAVGRDQEVEPLVAPSEVALWDLENGTRVFYRSEPQHSVQRIALSPHGGHLAVSSILFKDDRGLRLAQPQHVLRVWSWQRGELLLEDRSHRAPILGLTFHPDGRLAVGGAGDGMLRLWDPVGKRIDLEFERLGGIIEHLEFDPTGRRLVSATRRDVTIWDAVGGRRLLTLPIRPGAVDYRFNPQAVFSPNGSRLAATQNDGTVRIWDSRNRGGRSISQGHK